jgi:addiction module RelE/StbE family toxin
MKVAWSSRARRDLRNLTAYIAEDSIHGAELVAERILSAAKHLAKMPGSGRPGRVPESRECVVHKTPYILVYRIVSGRVRLLRVFHGARQWPSRFD